MNKERRTKRQRRGVNPDLDELNMSDDEIREAKALGTSALGVKDRYIDRARIKGSERVLSTTQPLSRPAACDTRKEPTTNLLTN